MQSKEELDCHSGWLACLRKNFDGRYVRSRLLNFNGCAYTHEKVESKEFAMYYNMLCPKMHATRNGVVCVARAVKKSLR